MAEQKVDTAPDQNKINGMEIAVLKVHAKEKDGKTEYDIPETIPFIIEPATVELHAISQDALKDCVKQLEAMGSYNEVCKQYGYKKEGEKSAGLVITSKKDPRIQCSVEFGGKWTKDSDQQAFPTNMDSPFKQDFTIKFFADVENLKKEMGVGSVPERPATPEELDIITKAREESKLESKEAKSVITEEADKKPVEHEVTIKMTIKEAAQALGYLSGRDAWKPMNDYMDADPYDDVYHDGYSAKDVQDWHEPKGMDGVNKIFPGAVALAAEAAERDGYAAAITKARHKAIEDAFEMINPSGEYMSGDGEMVSVKSGTGITSAKVDAPKDEVTIVVKNSEHLINDIVNGVGMFSPELDPYEKASDEEIKKSLINVLSDYFDVYGDRKPSAELPDHFTPDVDDEFMKTEIEFHIGEMSLEDIAQAVIDAADEGRLDTEKEAAKVATKLTGKKMKEIMDAVASQHETKASHYSARSKAAKETPNEAKVRSGNIIESRLEIRTKKPKKEKVLSENLDPCVDADFSMMIVESINNGGNMGEHKSFGGDYDAVDMFGIPKEVDEAIAVSVKPIGDKPLSTGYTTFKEKDHLVHKDPESKEKEVNKMDAQDGMKDKDEKPKTVEAGSAIAKPASEVGKDYDEKDHDSSKVKVGDPGDDHGEHVEGKGKSDMQQKDLPAKEIKVGKPGDDHGKHVGESIESLVKVCDGLINKGLTEAADKVLEAIKVLKEHGMMSRVRERMMARRKAGKPAEPAKEEPKKEEAVPAVEPKKEEAAPVVEPKKEEVPACPEKKVEAKKTLSPEMKEKLKARWKK